jgi:hypothetical protein
VAPVQAFAQPIRGHEAADTAAEDQDRLRMHTPSVDRDA